MEILLLPAIILAVLFLDALLVSLLTALMRAILFIPVVILLTLQSLFEFLIDLMFAVSRHAKDLNKKRGQDDGK